MKLLYVHFCEGAKFHAHKQNFSPGANPTIASYNASVVKVYSAVNSMAHF
jgi:hypothetical protein